MELTEKQKETILSALKYCYRLEQQDLREARREDSSERIADIESSLSDLKDAVQALGSRV